LSQFILKSFYPFFFPISWYLIAATPVQTRERRRSRATRPPNTTGPSHTASWHNACLSWKPATLMCQRKYCTPADCVSVHAPGPPQESLEHNGTRTSLPAKPSPNPDDTGPIMHRPMGLLLAAGCDRAWTQTRISSGTASECDTVP
jgi:hypothetical protein